MRGSRRAVTVVLVHVLFAAVALGAIALYGIGDDPKLAGQHVTPPDPHPRLPDNPETLVLVRPPGFLVVDSTTVKAGNSPGVLGEVEADALTDAGVVTVKALVARDDDVTQGVWQMSVHDGGDPAKALRAIDDLYAAGGWTKAYSATDGVLVRMQKPAASQPLAGYRAHYVRGPYLVRIETYGIDQDRVDRTFAALAQKQLAAWPPR